MEKVTEKEITLYLKEKIRSLLAERSRYQSLLELLTSPAHREANINAEPVSVAVLNEKKMGRPLKKGK